jgi:magnesium transporter
VRDPSSPTSGPAPEAIAELVAAGDVDGLRAILDRVDVLGTADALARLDPEERPVPFGLLAKARAVAVFEALDPAIQEELLENLPPTSVAQLFEELDPDDRARLVDEMPAMVSSPLIAGLSPHEQELTRTLLAYPPGSAGRIMSPEFVGLTADMTVADALDRVRRDGPAAETVLVLPVTDRDGRLVGEIDLPDLVFADPASTIGGVMRPDALACLVDADREEAARLVQEADLVALPIVDHEARLVGILTVDDAMEILEEEVTEDLARGGAIQPLGRPYVAVSVLRLARSRLPWLLALALAATLTVNVLAAFEGTLAQVISLALFIPLLIGTGGNTGAQASTTVIRAIAVAEIRAADLGWVVLREARVGLLVGVMLGGLAFVPLTLLFDPQIGAIVGITLLAICTYATSIGAFLPMMASRIGVDPALMSAPLVTTLVDATGLVVYFLVARAILGI